jgi:hypothetical protein
LSIFVFHWLTLTSFIITLLFLNRFNRMATDTGSLESGHSSWHVLRLGIVIRKGLRKTWCGFMIICKFVMWGEQEKSSFWDWTLFLLECNEYKDLTSNYLFICFDSCYGRNSGLHEFSRVKYGFA